METLPFLTAYDPLGAASGSIDPLGAMRTYVALADLLLPGITTITTRSRYLSMICAAIGNAETARGHSSGARGLAERRKAIEPFERIWALACVAAQAAGTEGAADGLRGVRYAERRYREVCRTGQPVTPDFRLLKFQGRTGAVGTYWVTLVAGQLVDEHTGALTHEGRRLAARFPAPPLGQRDLKFLADPARAHRVRIDRSEFDTWAQECHLRAAEREEQLFLAEALTEDDRRESVSRALATMADNRPLPEAWDPASLRVLRATLQANPRAAGLGLPEIVDAVLVTEAFHEAVLRFFEGLLWWATRFTDRPASEHLADEGVRRMSERAVATASRVLEFRRDAEGPAVVRALDSLLAFATAISQCSGPDRVYEEVLAHHGRVQAGKLDGGVPKRCWVEEDRQRLPRPAPRYQRTEKPVMPAGRALTHPYRLEVFVHMLRENGRLDGAPSGNGRGAA